MDAQSILCLAAQVEVMAGHPEPDREAWRACILDAMEDLTIALEPDDDDDDDLEDDLEDDDTHVDLDPSEAHPSTCICPGLVAELQRIKRQAAAKRDRQLAQAAQGVLCLLDQRSMTEVAQALMAMHDLAEEAAS
jgi:hypothetical protein